MSPILITGASGFIGRHLVQAIARSHPVLAMSRRETEIEGIPFVRGDFASPEGRRLLDPYEIEAVIHLAAVTGGGTETEQLRVNVLGTHGLMRYGLERGCRKFVLASSIAAVGMQNVRFRPLQVPIPDEHPCLDRDGYGFSKYLMEEVARYLVRQNEELDVIALRLATILPEEAKPIPRKPGPVYPWALGSITLMYLSDAVRCLTLAAEAAYKPGIRILNAVGSEACVEPTVPDVLRGWWGPDAETLDLSWYERPGHERDAVYDTRRIAEELGFIPARRVLPEER